MTRRLMTMTTATPNTTEIQTDSSSTLSLNRGPRGLQASPPVPVNPWSRRKKHVDGSSALLGPTWFRVFLCLVIAAFAVARCFSPTSSVGERFFGLGGASSLIDQAAAGVVA